MASFIKAKSPVIAILLLLLPYYVSSSPALHIHREDSHPGKMLNSTHRQLISPRLSSQIIVHGFLFWASMGFLIPVGILAIRMSNREGCGRRRRIMFFIHATSQILSVILVVAGAVMSIKNFDNSFNNMHQRIGVTLYGLVLLQAFSGFLRPARRSKVRSVWFFMHWLLGTAVSLLGIINVYTGLEAYHKKTSTSIKIWVIFYTVALPCVAFLYLFQDKWDYIQKQGAILGNEPTITIQPDNDQDTMPKDKKPMETCNSD